MQLTKKEYKTTKHTFSFHEKKVKLTV